MNKIRRAECWLGESGQKKKPSHIHTFQITRFHLSIWQASVPPPLLLYFIHLITFFLLKVKQRSVKSSRSFSTHDWVHFNSVPIWEESCQSKTLTRSLCSISLCRCCQDGSGLVRNGSEVRGSYDLFFQDTSSFWDIKKMRSVFDFYSHYSFYTCPVARCCASFPRCLHFIKRIPWSPELGVISAPVRSLKDPECRRTGPHYNHHQHDVMIWSCSIVFNSYCV